MTTRVGIVGVCEKSLLQHHSSKLLPSIFYPSHSHTHPALTTHPMSTGRPLLSLIPLAFPSIPSRHSPSPRLKQSRSTSLTPRGYCRPDLRKDTYPSKSIRGSNILEPLTLLL